jgi:type VI secretion system secreted protein Hcp
MSRFMYFSITGLMVFAVALPASAANIFCTVVGAKQGQFQADPAVRGDATQILVYALTEELTVPFDPASGQISGRRQHSPVIIVKELDKSSPQFFTAAVTNETLRTVTCTLYRSSGGGMHAYYKIVLTNASIVEIKDSGDGVNGSAQGDERERISFAYQKIELTDLDSSVTAIDDWLSTG